MMFGVLKQRAPILPKAPKGCGWHFALIFKEMVEQAQTGNLRVVAVAQLKTVEFHHLKQSDIAIGEDGYYSFIQCLEELI
ncbi:hypothetical protein POTOM_032419 [Populus tomentosa]|uniref:Uncharacterized protein n=1 Tax=Populus tomentosa TaxID=118781 RepID=A0A8X8CSL0_POPTO|nr:hypothetical protein POTOM_032419 [Populus tomentosa]